MLESWWAPGLMLIGFARWNASPAIDAVLPLTPPDSRIGVSCPASSHQIFATAGDIRSNVVVFAFGLACRVVASSRSGSAWSDYGSPQMISSDRQDPHFGHPKIQHEA